MKHNIIIVDDHTLVSNTIADLINSFPQFEVIHQAKNGKELLDYLEKNKKDIALILLDINMPIMNGYETLLALKEKHASIKTLVLSMNDDETSIIKMMRAGACGYIFKTIKEEELLTALEESIAKGFYYTPQVMQLVVNQFQEKTKPTTLQFTEREKELLTYICTELTYKEIADNMCVSPKTIDGYREDLFFKLDVKSRIGLAVYALKNGFYKEG